MVKVNGRGNGWRFQDLTNKRFDSWLVLERDGKRHPTRWICKCDCGTVKSVFATCLTLKRSRSCGCRFGEFISASLRKEFGAAAFNNLYRHYISDARKKVMEFELTKEQFRTITSQLCYYCGIEPLQVYSKGGTTYGPYTYNGIDRVDNNRGYTIDNCVACCGDCNKMKMCKSEKEFIDKIKRICAHRNIEICGDSDE